MQNSPTLIHEGWLLKQGLYNRQYQRRYFRLRSNDTLYYYKSMNSQSVETGTVALKTVEVSYTRYVDPTKDDLNIVLHARTSEGRTFRLRAESAADKTSWVNALSQAEALSEAEKTLIPVPCGVASLPLRTDRPLSTVVGRTISGRPVQRRKIKFLLVGNSAVGKTSLILRFTNSKPDARLPGEPGAGSIPSTVGVDFKTKNFKANGAELLLQIWDTAGQERFHAVTCAYYRGAHAVILVYDTTDRKSFDDVNRWMDDIASYTDKEYVDIALVGNCCDCVNERTVEHEEGRKLAEEHGVFFFETSVRNNTNVELLFRTLVEATMARTCRPPVDDSLTLVAEGHAPCDTPTAEGHDACCVIS
jgi:small GTP-binding protein